MTVTCNKDELIFLGDRRGLVDYKEFGVLCEDCREKMPEKPHLGISAHGFFCAAIIASRKLPAQLGELHLGSLRGLSPPPRVALYATGCPCGTLTDGDIVMGIYAAMKAKVDVLSISLGRIVPGSLRNEENSADYHAKDMASLEAFRMNIVTVLPAGNHGSHGLRTVGKAGPWCLTVASCTAKRKFKTKVEIACDFDVDLPDLEGYSISMFPTESSSQNWVNLRNDKIYQRFVDCSTIMYLYEARDGFKECFIKPGVETDYSASATPFVGFSKDQTNTILSYLHKYPKIYVRLTSSEKSDLEGPPLVSNFSSRGPCSYFKELMKPDICAPGEHIAAAWPRDEPLGGYGEDCCDTYNVCNGTSFAVPHVAAGVAKLRAERKFSASAIISAIITTAMKMDGKDLAGEYAYGAGLMDMNKAMQPGCVFEETADNHAKSFYGRMESHKSPYDNQLNLPYFSATFTFGSDPRNYVFRRRMKSVEEGKSRYKAEYAIAGTTLALDDRPILLKASPSTLDFNNAGEEKEFTLLVHLPHTKASKTSLGNLRFGRVSASLIWVNERNNEIRVNCPIILSSESNFDGYTIVEA